MDLVTLTTACALSVEPKVMHALIWEQSGGEPWSFSVPSESARRVLPTIQDAIREARNTRSDGGRIRVGLTGLSTHPHSVTTMTFVPCANITTAARQLTQLVERCKKTSKPDPIYCAIAAYRGSWDRPDRPFADAVRMTVEKGNAPNLEMPRDAYFDGSDIASVTPPGPDDRDETPERTRDDRERGWSSALFPAKPAMPNGPLGDDVPTRSGPAADLRSTDHKGERATSTNSLGDSLFVPRSTERRP